jgi:hypothetical protein
MKLQLTSLKYSLALAAGICLLTSAMTPVSAAGFAQGGTISTPGGNGGGITPVNPPSTPPSPSFGNGGTITPGSGLPNIGAIDFRPLNPTRHHHVGIGGGIALPRDPVPLLTRHIPGGGNGGNGIVIPGDVNNPANTGNNNGLPSLNADGTSGGLGDLSPAAGGNAKYSFIDCVNKEVLSRDAADTSGNYDNCSHMPE